MRFDDRFHIRAKFGPGSFFIERGDHIFGVQALGVGNTLLLIDAGQQDAVGQAQAGHQIGFEHLAPQRIRARLQHGPQPRLRINRAQRAQRFADGRGVVGEVVDDVMPPAWARTSSRRLTLLKLASADWMTLCCRCPARGQRSRGGGVERVVLAGQAHLQFSPQRAAVPDLPASKAVSWRRFGCANRLRQ
jgi:hypothetical protein